MLRPCAVVLASVLSLATLSAQTAPPAVSGFVTAVKSDGSLEVSGYRLELKTSTPVVLRASSGRKSEETPVPLSQAYLGEQAVVFGKRDGHKGIVRADRLVLLAPETGEIAGAAVIDAVPSGLASVSVPRDSLVVRADGYFLVISPRTSVTTDPPLTAGSTATTNLWITYHGTLRRDGTVLLDRAHLRANLVSDGEDKLRSKHEYDPSAVSADAHQSAASKFFKGVDPEQIPPYDDPVMQARVERIGRSLVPAYQRGLADTDPAKIHFRFQVVEVRRRRDSFTLPNGIIAVAPEIVDRLSSDDELAAVLADDIATALEKQCLRAQPARYALIGAGLAGTAAGIFVPGLDLAAGLAGGGVAQHLERLREDQSGRVSLGLLQDAGYDLLAAPLAWWRLSSSKTKPLADIPLPERSANVYRALGQTWRTTGATAQQDRGGRAVANAPTP